MHARSWIAFYKIFEENSRLDENARLEPADIEASIVEGTAFGRGWYYNLTTAGGSVWESFARPDWERFIWDENDHDENEVRTRLVIAASEQRLQRYLQAAAREVDIEAGSTQFSALEPWQATYWKMLPSAAQCRFRCFDKPPDPRSGPSTNWLQDRWCDWR
jgi:hypothetical protein